MYWSLIETLKSTLLTFSKLILTENLDKSRLSPTILGHENLIRSAFLSDCTPPTTIVEGTKIALVLASIVHISDSSESKLTSSFVLISKSSAVAMFYPLCDTLVLPVVIMYFPLSFTPVTDTKKQSQVRASGGISH